MADSGKDKQPIEPQDDYQASKSKSDEENDSNSVVVPNSGQHVISETKKDTSDSDPDQNSIGQTLPEIKPVEKLDSESDDESNAVQNTVTGDQSEKDSKDKIRADESNREDNTVRQDSDPVSVQVKIDLETEKSKAPGPHLSSSKHDDRIKNMALARDYTAELSAKFFGTPFDVGSDADGPTLFTVANSDVGRPWESIPFREKFQWYKEDAPCFTFNISIPDERTGHGQIPICIFRQQLEYKEESSLIIHQEEV